jgi:DNA-binding response OmpR family regulator
VLNKKLLLLEDDPALSKSLIKYLRINDFEVDWAKDGDEAINLTYTKDYDLYIFDINVPRINGIDALTKLREAQDFTPTIIISALTDVSSVTKGFIAGADDYIKKPFDPEELLIRIKAKTKEAREYITINDIKIDIKTDEIFQNDKPVFLSEVQKKLFFSLATNYPNPVTKDELMYHLEKPTDLALRVNISKLKKRLDADIKNVRGVGYKII